jgi:hypothetical protein
MSANLKPLVFNPTADPPIQVLQPTDNIKTPTEERVQVLEQQVRALARALLNAGFDLEDSLTGNL